MAQDIEQEVISPEEKLLNEQIDNLLKNVDPGHGEPLQVELAGRFEKTVNDFHDEVASIIENIRNNSEEQRNKLKEMWDHRNEEKPQRIAEPTEEPTGEVSSWEKRLENKKTASKAANPKVTKPEDSKKEESKKKGFFKRKK
ncbi:MAG: hypothetical protein ACE5D0_09015 [Fidelibacterota bacterium]